MRINTIHLRCIAFYYVHIYMYISLSKLLHVIKKKKKKKVET